MGQKKSHPTPGIIWRDSKTGGCWHIDKQVYGQTVRRSCRTADPREADAYLARIVDEIRKANQFGQRPRRKFEEAAIKYLAENQHKRSIASDASLLKRLKPYLNHLELRAVHMGTLQPFIKDAQQRGNKANTINLHLSVVRRILNLAAGTWRDASGLTWLEHPTKIVHLPVTDARPPYPISWTEQGKLLSHLPPHQHDMVLYAVNTGCREQEIVDLRWQWERRVQGLDVVLFELPGGRTKNAQPRIVVLNRIAAEVVNRQRGLHPTHVFTYQRPTPLKGPNAGITPPRHPVQRINTTAWRRARTLAGMPDLHEHDLKHTFGRRLRAAGVPKETRTALLGHTTGDITTHYSAAEIKELWDAVEAICTPTEGVLLQVVSAT